MRKMPLVKAVMTPFPHAVALDTPLLEARAFMLAHRVRHLPVVDGSRLVGIVTDRDIKLFLGPEFDYPPPGELKVADAYQPDAYVVGLDAPLDEVLATMAERHIGSALVSRKGKLAGILTVTDVCRAYAEDLRARFGAGDGGGDVA